MTKERVNLWKLKQFEEDNKEELFVFMQDLVNAGKQFAVAFVMGNWEVGYLPDLEEQPSPEDDDNHLPRTA